MQATRHLSRIENLLILSLGFGLFISKPVIHISATGLILLFIAKIALDPVFRYTVLRDRVVQAASGIFLFGVIATTFSSGLPEDIGWIARKSIYLVLLGPLLFAFLDPSNRQSALIGLTIGFWMAFGLTAHQFNWIWDGYHRPGATWLVDTWAVLCALYACFLVPLVLRDHFTPATRTLFGFTALAALFMVITTGSRGPLLGALVGIGLYVALSHRRLLAYGLIAFAVAYLPVKHMWPTQVASVENRILSIGDLKTNESNFTRLALWETGVARVIDQLRNGNFVVLIGEGRTGSATALTDFYQSGYGDTASILPGMLSDRVINDLHSMYLDSTVKNGLIWTAANLLLLGWLALGNRSQKSLRANIGPPYGLAVLCAFLVNALTASILPHYATIFAVYFLTLSRGLQTSSPTGGARAKL